MRRIPDLAAGCILVGVIACATAAAWLQVTGARSLTAAAVIVCTITSVTVALLLEALVRQVRRQRPTATRRHRKADTP